MDEEAYYLSQIPKPQPTKLGAMKVSAVLNRVIQQKGYAAVQSTELLSEAWAHAVGPELAAMSRPGKIERGNLLVHVHNKVVLMELEFQKAKILRTLQTRLPEFSIQKLTIRSGQ